MIVITSILQLWGYLDHHFETHSDVVHASKLRGNRATNYEDVLCVKITPRDGRDWCVFFTLTFDNHGGVSGIDGVAGYWDETTVPDAGGRYCGHVSAETSYRPCYYFDSQKLDDYMRGIFGALYD